MGVNTVKNAPRKKGVSSERITKTKTTRLQATLNLIDKEAIPCNRKMFLNFITYTIGIKLHFWLSRFIGSEFEEMQ